MGAWKFRDEGDWRNRIRAEANKLSIRASSGELQGPELRDSIVSLIEEAHRKHPSHERVPVAPSRSQLRRHPFGPEE